MSDSDFTVTSSWTGGGPLTNAKPGGSSKQPSAGTLAHAGPALLVRTVALGLGWLGVLGWALGRTPELLSVGLLRELWVAMERISPVVPIAPGQYDINGRLVLAGLAAVALAVIAYTAVRQAATVVMPLAGLVVLALVWNALPMLDDLRNNVPALVLTVLGAGATVRGAWQLRQTQAPGKVALDWTPPC